LASPPSPGIPPLPLPAALPIFAYWANGFAHHVAGTAWGEFAAARVRELYPDAPVKAVAESSEPRQAGHGKKPAAPVAKAKGKPKEPKSTRLNSSHQITLYAASR